MPHRPKHRPADWAPTQKRDRILSTRSLVDYPDYPDTHRTIRTIDDYPEADYPDTHRNISYHQVLKYGSMSCQTPT
jgi:hypothetical protein